MSYEDVCRVLGKEGKKYRSDLNGNIAIDFYRWTYCNNENEER